MRRAYLRQHHGFECTCARCGCDDPADELDFEERLERARCPLPGCGTGLSYRLAGSRRRCVQCGGTWDDEGSSGEEDLREMCSITRGDPSFPYVGVENPVSIPEVEIGGRG